MVARSHEVSGARAGMTCGFGDGPVGAAQSNDLETQLDLEAQSMAEALGAAEASEGIAAFLEKRSPDFRRLRGG